jgi:hypothetical protein
MALSTYADLQAALANLLGRTDLTGSIPDFIALFEADFDGRADTAMHRRRICRSSADIDSEYAALPENFMAVQSIALATDPVRRLEYIEPDSMVRLIEDQSAWEALNQAGFGADPAPPKYYTVVGTEIRFFPAPQATYSCDLTAYERLARLSPTTPSNWLSTYFPQVYLYGSALHSAPFLADDERLATWRGLYEESVAKCAGADPMQTSKLPLRTEFAGLTGRLSRVS